MSRVNEAMRRAAGVTLSDQPVGASTKPFEDAELAEAFPVETPARRPETPAPDVPLPGRPGAPDVEGTLTRRFEASMSEKIVVDSHMLPASREQYRRLAAFLHQAQITDHLRVILVSSAVANEGKTLTASNLALTLSESYHRSVLLVDADLRRPSLNGLFGIQGTPGLTECLTAHEDKVLPLHQVSPYLAILPAGRPNSDPMAGLTSKRMKRLISEVRDAFDWVIIDTPPVGLMSDANLLSSIVDGAILVVRAASTPYHLVQRAADALGKERILGVVLNQASGDPKADQDYYGYYGMDGADAKR